MFAAVESSHPDPKTRTLQYQSLDLFFLFLFKLTARPSGVIHVTFVKRNQSLCMSCHTSCVGGSARLWRRRRDLLVPLIPSRGGEKDLFSQSGDGEVPQSAKLGQHLSADFDVAAAGGARADLVFVFSLRHCGRRTRGAAQLREMLWIYATFLLLSQAWGRETGLNLNSISEPFHLRQN